MFAVIPNFFFRVSSYGCFFTLKYGENRLNCKKKCFLNVKMAAARAYETYFAVNFRGNPLNGSKDIAFYL